MKALILFFVISGAVLSKATAQVESQNPSTSTPEIPAVNDTLNIQKEDRVEVQLDKIPGAMRDELERNDKYKGWETSNVYFERNTGQYVVHIKSELGTRTYRFDKDGAPLTTGGQSETEGEKN